MNEVMIEDLMLHLVKAGGSDLHLAAGQPPYGRFNGKLRPIHEESLTDDDCSRLIFSLLSNAQRKQLEQNWELDCSYGLRGVGRFRINVYRQRGTYAACLRALGSHIPSLAELGSSPILEQVCRSPRGLVLVTGPTGSGKSTTLASVLNQINLTRSEHILTIEDPIEFSHPNLKSIVNQREVGVDTDSYARALKACLREAPDVILIGEIRDRETMSAALELANTGHLCISTMHANNANQAMERVINMFPHEYHAQLFMDLATNLSGVISQRLIHDLTGKRCAAIEVMINTPHIASLILKGELNEIKAAMTSSGSKGMVTFDNALYELYKNGKISLEETLKNADSSNDLEAKINFG